MLKLKSRLIAVAAVFGVLLAVPAISYADHGSGDGGSDNNTSQTSDGDNNTSSNDTTENDNSGDNSNDTTTNDNTSDSDTTDSGSGSDQQARHGGRGSDGEKTTIAPQSKGKSDERTNKAETEAETEGQDFIDNLLKTHKRHTEQERQKNCQAAQKGLETKLSNIQKNASKFQTLINEVYQKALDYQQANNLSPAGFDQLVSTANSAKDTASASVSALASLSVNLDCSSSSVAGNVATFRAAAQQARTDLVSYKTAVKAVLTALEGAATNETQQ